jgi:hypothetical protein
LIIPPNHHLAQPAFDRGLPPHRDDPGDRSPMWWNITAVREAIRQYNVNRVETYQLD